MSKKILILQASTDVSQSEIDNINSQCILYGINPTVIEITTFEGLHDCLSTGEKYDYLYLATHGCEDYWGNISGTLQIKWTDFAAIICSTQVLNEGAVIFHSCCRGGVAQVAYQMFAVCFRIEYICGPRHNLTSADLITAFNLFLYNLIMKQIDPVRCAEKVLMATDIRLVCFDRIESTGEAGYFDHVEQFGPTIDMAFTKVLEYEVLKLGEYLGNFQHEEIIYSCFLNKNPTETFILKADGTVAHKLFKRTDGDWEDIENGRTEKAHILGALIESLQAGIAEKNRHKIKTI